METDEKVWLRSKLETSAKMLSVLLQAAARVSGSDGEVLARCHRAALDVYRTEIERIDGRLAPVWLFWVVLFASSLMLGVAIVVHGDSAAYFVALAAVLIGSLAGRLSSRA